MQAKSSMEVRWSEFKTTGNEVLTQSKAQCANKAKSEIISEQRKRKYFIK